MNRLLLNSAVPRFTTVSAALTTLSLLTATAAHAQSALSTDRAVLAGAASSTARP